MRCGAVKSDRSALTKSDDVKPQKTSIFNVFLSVVPRVFERNVHQFPFILFCFVRKL